MALAASLVLSGCGGMWDDLQKEMGAGMELEKNSGLAAKGSDFNRELFGEYTTLARSEYLQGDYRDSDAYAIRARQSANGGTVEPIQIGTRDLPPDKVPELSSARGRLMTALASGARDKLPRDAAQAQTNFDCWMEQQEENRQPDHIAACRSNFLMALAKIEVVPAPPPPPTPEKFTIFFGYNSANLDADRLSEVNGIAARARQMNAKNIVIEGHADRSGSSKYNLKLSQKREATIQNALVVAGLNASVSGQAYGEDRPAVATADGIPEARNRRVVVTLNP
jgi:outer membrane protein OmpA-like peptidoglycan-associated protein